MQEELYNMPLQTAIRELPLSTLFMILEKNKNRAFALAAFNTAILQRRKADVSSFETIAGCPD